MPSKILLVRLFFMHLFVCATTLLWGQQYNTWRYHNSYETSTAVEASDMAVWSASLTGLLRYDRASGEIQTYDKTNGLSDVQIRQIAWNAEIESLVIAYENSNIDLINDFGVVTNIPDILNSTVTGSKLINAMYTEGSKAFLSCDFGIVVVDLINFEIEATYIIGNGGQAVVCYDFSKAEDTLYAITNEGLKVAFDDGSNLLDFQSWNTINPSITGGIEHWEGACFMHSLDTLYKLESLDSLTSLVPLSGYQTIQLAASDSLYLIQTEGDFISGIVDSSQIFVWSEGSFDIRLSGFSSYPLDIERSQDKVYISDYRGGLREIFEDNTQSRRFLGGQRYSAKAFRIEPGLDKVWVSSGSTDFGLGKSPGDPYIYDGVSAYNGSFWENYVNFNVDVLNPTFDIVPVREHPSRNEVWAGSFYGASRFLNSADEHFDSSNSAILPKENDPSFQIVSDIDFDKSGRVWMTNLGSQNPLVVLDNDGTWYGFDPANAPLFVTRMVIDNADNVWMATTNDGLWVYNRGNILSSVSDDPQALHFTAANSELQSNTINDLAIDRDGALWVGTGQGVVVIDCPSSVFSSSFSCTKPRRIIVTLGDYSEYLFNTEVVQAIAVDGGNRKWVGTTNGATLISSSGEEEILQLTTENSPLPSNTIFDIGILGRTGDVFFATDLGLASFIGDASEGADKHSDVQVYPNPIEADYVGPISVIGLVSDAYVKVMDSRGRLVYQDQALGGKFVWDGLRQDNTAIHPGVYYIISVSPNGQESIVATLAKKG